MTIAYKPVKQPKKIHSICACIIFLFNFLEKLPNKKSLTKKYVESNVELKDNFLACKSA